LPNERPETSGDSIAHDNREAAMRADRRRRDVARRLYQHAEQGWSWTAPTLVRSAAGYAAGQADGHAARARPAPQSSHPRAAPLAPAGPRPRTGPGRSGRAPIRGWVASRLFDMVAAVVILIMLAPALLVIALAVRASGRGPILFAHRRIGRNGDTFPCFKFRTMVADAEHRLEAMLAADANLRAQWQRSQKLDVDPRVTGIGRLLRKTSLDELPQLFNVLRGEMSLVGPRPIVADELPRYGRRIDSYLQVCPGITGLWQVSGRSDTHYRRRVALDVIYARRRSLPLNLIILVYTVPAVFGARGSR